MQSENAGVSALVGSDSQSAWLKRALRISISCFVCVVFCGGLLSVPQFSEAGNKRTQVHKKSSYKKKGTRSKKHAYHPHKKKSRRHVKKYDGPRRPLRRYVRAKALYCVDLTGKRLLMARNPDKQLPVASLTKLITAMVIMDHMGPTKKMRVPSYIRKVPRSVVGLVPGDIVTVKDLLHGLLIGSGNDCAETLASGFPGGRKRFIHAMNKKARELGARHTRFYTPSGLDKRIYAKGKGKRRKLIRVKSNVSTAREIALIARKAFEKKHIRQIVLKKSYHMDSRKRKSGYLVRTTNRLLREGFPLEGGKTGYTHRAGHCLATQFSRGRNELLIVVLGSPDHFKDTKRLYKKAIKKVKRLRSAKKKNRRVEQARHPHRTPARLTASQARQYARLH